MKILNKIIYLLSPHERKRAGLLMVMILIMAILDMIGVASIMPFITVLTNPEIIENNLVLSFMYDKSSIFNVGNTHEFITVLGILVFFVLIISLAFKALTIYAQIRFVQMREYSLGRRLMQGYLSQPYSWLMSRNSADLSKTIFSEVHLVMNQALSPMFAFIANTAVVIAICILLIIINPFIALIISLTLGLAYWIIYAFVRGYLKVIGQKRLEVNQIRFTTVNEAFGAGKEVKLGGLEDVYIDRFSETTKAFARHQASVAVLSRLPRYVIEAIGFGGIILVIIYYLIKTSTFTNALPVIALYAFAGYRILPSLQNIYNAISQLRFATPALDNLYNELKLHKIDIKPNSNSKKKLSFEKKICLKNIEYNYPNSTRTSVKNISIEISAQTTVALVGATGSGKTTTADIILGLLESKKGTLEVDGQLINDENRYAWQKNIGYVPQHIYLTDDTVRSNIALGVDSKDIDQESIERAAKVANLHNFIKNKLSKGYDTIIGERGIRLSGGERQRLGIARALYHNPNVLVLDEATSAMDNLTEKSIMQSINTLRKDTTIILIAHRLSTIKNCDKIFLLDKGELIKQGTFDELIETSDLFKKNAIS